MNELLLLLPAIVERGLIFALIIMGIYVSSRILHFDDLTVEGSFGVAGALTAALLSKGYNPFLSIIAAICVGAMAGMCTALLHTQLHFNHLMSGIIVTTALFSVSLKIAGANIALQTNTIFSFVEQFPFGTLFLLSTISIGLLLFLIWFLTTELGFLVRATGINQHMVRMLGKKVHRFIWLGLIIANMLNALAGSLFVQYVGFYSIWNNVGILIIGLAGLILAETFSKNLGPSLLLGSIIYQIIIATTFELQLDQDWNKMITALLIIALIIWKQQFICPTRMEERC